MKRTFCLGVLTLVGVIVTVASHDARQGRARLALHEIADNLYMLGNAP